jgi:HAD superfamily hydrolase (TIGR01548 family)
MSPKLYKSLLLDMDGVLAEVSKSYRASIVATCHAYGATSIDYDVIGDWKAKGGCNNDWMLSLDLINSDPSGKRGLTLDEVTETFEDFYQGKDDTPGLCELESLIPSKETLQELRKRSQGMAIVTGRPRKDCEKFLKQHQLEHLFDCCVCMEDGPAKPDPFPVKRACELLKIEPSEYVILVGDTPDDIRSALAAGCRGVGVSTPLEADELAAMNGKPHDSSKLCVAMKGCGVDIVLPPGFVELVDMFPAN